MTESTPLSPASASAPGIVGAAPYLAGLNETQRTAVETTDGPVLVLAGAGTGKTRVLTTRLTHILATRRATPGQVMAVTFTNKAAREMRERVEQMLNRPTGSWWIGTFHALAARILRRNADRVGLKSNYTILDADDQLRLIKQLTAAANIDTKRFPDRAVLGIIQRWKDRGLMPDRVTAGEGNHAGDGRILTVYERYQARLTELNAADFGDLLLLCLVLFRDHPDVLADYQRDFKYMLVDEYQDTNVAQYLWLRALAQGSGNLCCVGDDDQSIYSWRGAEIANILRFEKDFPGAAVIRLERNYRSTGNILAAASGLIAHNDGRLGKTLWTEGDAGEKVSVTGVWDGIEEARSVCEEVESLQRKGHSIGRMAVLVRAGFQTRAFEERLITTGVPYKVIGGLRFYERAEIRDAVAYLRVIAQPDDDLAFERIINTPKRGIGPAVMSTLHTAARNGRMSLTQALTALLATDELKPKPRGELGRLMDDFARWRALAGTEKPWDLTAQVLDESGYVEMWRRDTSPDAQGRVENLKELVASLAEFDTLGGFLEHVSLVMENDEGGDTEKLTLMTLHGAKGLEFDIVFLPGWEEGLFPHQKALDENGANGLEEERRLAYVGLTRARKKAYVSFAANRQIYGNWQAAVPSRFIDEMPADHVEVASAPGLYGGGPMRDIDRPTGRFLDSGADWGNPRSRARRAPVIDAEYAPAPAKAKPKAARFKPGQRVFHQKFGYGLVLRVDGDKLEISFDKAGIKKVLEGFVEGV